MEFQPDARIFLADQRGISQTKFLRSYHTLNFGSYVQEGREPFGALCLLNDDTLRAGASLNLQVEQDTTVVLLPVAGGLEHQSELTTDFLEPSQVGLLSLQAGMTYTVANPYETETITFVQIWFTAPSGQLTPSFQQFAFDLTQRNTLLPLGQVETTPVRGFIGQFDGRAEGSYRVEPTGSVPGRIFVFVLSGVFEAANRLLHARDGLALSYEQVAELEFEALSKDAILLLFDLA